MSLLMWTAVLVGVWCAASGLAALVVGPALRRHAQARATAPTRSVGLDPLDTGPMRMWLAELPETREPTRPSPSTAT